MSSEPPPRSYVIVVMVGLAALAVGLMVGGATALELVRAQGEQARNAVIAGGLVQWAKLLLGCTLLLLGFERRQEPLVRGGALIAGAIVVAAVALGR